MSSAERNRYEVAIAAARQAGDLALRYFDQDVPVELKKDASPVTIADREAESLLRTTVLTKFPDDAFLGEETGLKEGTSGFRWVIDPVDGTRSFVRGVPLWATLVGLEYRDQQIAGIVYAPPLNQIWRALRGDGAYRNDRGIHVSDVTTLAESHLYYSSLAWFARAHREEAFLRLMRQTQRQRGFGDFYGFVLVAQGSGELMVEHGVHVWDVAGIKAIVEEAGGRFTDWDNNPTAYRTDVIASNGRVHDQALQFLRGPKGEQKK
jgi:histidinol-phosphatase